MFRSRIRELIQQAVAKLQEEGTLPKFVIPDFSVEVPENPAHGDYATNIALVVAKLAKERPLAVAAPIAQKLSALPSPLIARAEVAGPGFVNVFLRETHLWGELSSVLQAGEIQSRLDRWEEKKVMVEFTDPNPFKEFHIGHLYSNTVGESLSRILEAAGAVVKRTNYQGDVGLHVAKAVWGMQRRMVSTAVSLAELEGKSLEERMQFLGQAYADGARAFDTDERAKEEIVELNKKIFALDAAVADLYTKGREWSLEYFERIYQRLGTKFDFYYFERDVGKVGANLVREQLARGVFEESEGAVVFPGEKYGLHRRVFINSEGLPTYEAKELGLAPTKYRDFPYDLSIIVTGSEIVDYFKVLIAALKEINPVLGGKTLHIAHGMVRLARGKMSSRSGEVVRAEDLLNEVKDRVRAIMEALESPVAPERRPEVAERIAVGAVKYSLLRSSIGQDVIFDVDTSLSLAGDSGPYLQYTHARFKSILRKSAELTRNRNAEQTRNLSTPGITLDGVEHRLLVTMLRLPETIEDALKDYTPNTLANYLYGLARQANEFYHSHPVLQELDETKRSFRIALVMGVALTLAKGLDLLGIAAPQEM